MPAPDARLPPNQHHQLGTSSSIKQGACGRLFIFQLQHLQDMHLHVIPAGDKATGVAAHTMLEVPHKSQSRQDVAVS